MSTEETDSGPVKRTEQGGASPPGPTIAESILRLGKDGFGDHLQSVTFAFLSRGDSPSGMVSTAIRAMLAVLEDPGILGGDEKVVHLVLEIAYQLGYKDGIAAAKKEPQRV